MRKKLSEHSKHSRQSDRYEFRIDAILLNAPMKQVFFKQKYDVVGNCMFI